MRFGLMIVRVRSMATMGCGSLLMKMSCVVSSTTRTARRSTTGGVSVAPAAAKACARSSGSDAAEPSATPRRKSRRFTWVNMGLLSGWELAEGGGRFPPPPVLAASPVLFRRLGERLAFVDDVHGKQFGGRSADHTAAMHLIAHDVDAVARLDRLGALAGEIEIDRALHDVSELVAVMDVRREAGARRRLDHAHIDLGRARSRQIGMLQHIA